jgi:hypothetical protein
VDAPAKSRAFPFVVAALGALLSFWLSGPYLSVGLNWDSGSILGRIATDPHPWSIRPWNAHFGEYSLYVGGWQLFGRLGLRLIAAVRATQALFFGAAMGALAATFQRRIGSRALAAALVLLWATSFANVWLHITVEDNVVSIALSAITLCFCLAKMGDWRRSTSLIAGALMAAAALMSWQATPYLFPTCYAPLVSTSLRGRGRFERLLQPVLIVASFVATILLFCLLLGVTSRLGVRILFDELLSRPTGHWQLQIFDLAAQLRTLGIATYYYAFHLELPTLPYVAIGAGMLVVLLTIALFGIWRLLRDGDPVLHWLSLSLLVITVVTLFYQDVDYGALKRFDFLPLFLILIAGMSFAGQRVPKLPVASVLLALVLVQSTLAWRAIRARQRQFPTLETRLDFPHPAPSWYGQGGRSWYAHFSHLRDEHPDACRFVLAEAEVDEGKWWLEIPTAVLSELRAPVLLGVPGASSHWRVPLTTLSPAQAAARGLIEPCAYVSPDARTLINRAGTSARTGERDSSSSKTTP